ncbi:hypothetical protein BH23ACT9_BH23ACT9_15140 [soil metagenome]
MLLVVVLTLLAGCQVRIDTGIDLRSDNTAVVDLTFGIMFEEGLPDGFADEMGEDPMNPEDAEADIMASADACGFSAADVDVQPFSEDGFDGARIRLDGITLDAVNCFFSEDGDEQFFETFSLTREGDEYVFNASIRNLAADFEEGLGQGFGNKTVGGREVAQEEVDPEAILSELEALGSELEGLEGFEDLQGFEDLFGGGFGEGLENPAELFQITIRLSFPGGVRDSNATRVEGSTAIWELDGSGGVLTARGGAGGGGADTAEAATADAGDDTAGADGGATSAAAEPAAAATSFLPWLLIGLGVLVLVVVLVLLLRRRGQSSPPPGQFDPNAPQGYGSAPQGYGGAPGQGYAAAPPAWSQQPQQPQWDQQAPPQQPQWDQQPTPPPVHQPAPSPQQDQPAQSPGYNPDSTRTFRPEDLLPPSDPPKQ